MPTTRKRTGGGTNAGTKKQKTLAGSNKNQPDIEIDEGFKESNKVHVHIDDDGTIWDASLNLSNVSGNNNKVRVRTPTDRSLTLPSSIYCKSWSMTRRKTPTMLTQDGVVLVKKVKSRPPSKPALTMPRKNTRRSSKTRVVSSGLTGPMRQRTRSTLTSRSPMRKMMKKRTTTTTKARAQVRRAISINLLRG